MKIFYCILFLFQIAHVSGQLSNADQQAIDSLSNVIVATSSDTTRVNALLDWNSIIYLTDPKKDLELLLEASEICEQNLGRTLSVKELDFYKSAYGYILNDLGVAYSNFSDHKSALQTAFKGLRHVEKWGDSLQIATAANNVGTNYSNIGQSKSALKYYKRAIKLSKNSSDPITADAKNNIGLGLADENPEVALSYFLEAYRIYDSLNVDNSELSALAHTSTNIGKAYHDMGRNEKALDYYSRAFAFANRSKNDASIANTCISISAFYYDLGNISMAIEFAEHGLKSAEAYGTIDIKRDAYFSMYTYSRARGAWEEALEHHEKYVVYRDSFSSDETRFIAYQQDINYQYEKKTLADSLKIENDRAIERAVFDEQKETQRIGIIALVGVLSLIVVIAIVIFRGKRRSDALLLNILPKETADELKKKGHAEAKLMKETTVIFTDFKGFTAMSEALSPEDLVKEINHCFSAFDLIMEKHGVEKIKTIGDAYMAVGGLPTPNSTHATNVVQAALEIQEFMLQRSKEKQAENLPYFEIRIGVHTGPVVAGIVGVKKFQYDVWGDTVNTAARMESSCEVGKVNISESTYHLIKGDPAYSFETRGKIEAKGKGLIEMYFVEKND